MTEKQVLMNAYEDASCIRDMKKEYINRIYDELSDIAADLQLSNYQNMIVALNEWYDSECETIMNEFWDFIKIRFA